LRTLHAIITNMLKYAHWACRGTSKDPTPDGGHRNAAINFALVWPEQNLHLKIGGSQSQG